MRGDSWGPYDIGDLTGTVMMVTGANSGIGFETTLQLAAHGAHVVMACRDEAKARTAMERIQGLDGEASIEVLELDLSDQASVHRAAAEFGRRHDRLDVLVNNAGVMASPYRLTADGFELQVATNHLGPFALTGLVIDHLLTTPGARVVTVSSVLHRTGLANLDDVAGERRRGRWSTYSTTKLDNLLFTYELDRRLRAAGAGTRAVAVHPGWTRSNLAVSGPTMGSGRLRAKAGRVAGQLGGQSAGHGALPSLYAATAPGVASGSFYGPSGAFHLYGPPELLHSSRRSRRPADAAALWEESERLTGVPYAFGPTRGPGGAATAGTTTA